MSVPARKHLFKNSPFFDFEKFAKALPDWPEPKQRFYHEAARLHSEAKGATYLNWVAAVQTWDRMRPEKWREVKIYRKVAANLARQMTPKEVMELRDKGLLPEHACWCCGTPWISDGIGGYAVGCKCTHWSESLQKSFMCRKCKLCLVCCTCDKQMNLEVNHTKKGDLEHNGE
jgi:hypothetical protein